ncbi:MAG: MHJ_0274 family protein [Metamycoplasmataceae bacterium]
MNDWIVWVIFGILIVGLIVFMLFSFIKDKKKNKEIFRKKIELKKATEKTSKELAVKIKIIIEKNNQEVQNFIPSIGNIKMKDINFLTRKMLKEIKESKMFKLIYLKEQSNKVFVDSLDVLIETKSNLWEKKCQNEINYFFNLEKEFQKFPEYNDILTKEKEIVDKRFNEIESTK